MSYPIRFDQGSSETLIISQGVLQLKRPAQTFLFYVLESGKTIRSKFLSRYKLQSSGIKPIGICTISRSEQRLMARQSRCLAKRIFGTGSTKRAPSIPSQRSFSGRVTAICCVDATSCAGAARPHLYLHFRASKSRCPGFS